MQDHKTDNERGQEVKKMPRYLDPKVDLTFKKVFGEHEELVMSLLNALLPLDEGRRIEHVEYLPSELVPETPVKKNSIVDVRCKDNHGRQFIVEMQMEWTTAFKQRVLFNASKAYVRQLGRSRKYHLLQPVYSLSLVNDVFEPKMEEFYHYYRMVHEEHTDKVIDGLNLVFVELPKFKPQTVMEKRMAVLWLRFLTEIDEDTREVPRELLENPEVSQALDIVEQSAYDEIEMYQYDKFWDTIRVEQAFIDEAEIRYGIGREEGMAEGMEKGMEKGMAEGIANEKRDNARKMKSLGADVGFIAQVTGLTTKEIEAL